MYTNMVLPSPLESEPEKIAWFAFVEMTANSCAYE
jgi:hypothetical protein